MAVARAHVMVSGGPADRDFHAWASVTVRPCEARNFFGFGGRDRPKSLIFTCIEAQNFNPAAACNLQKKAKEMLALAHGLTALLLLTCLICCITARQQ